MKEMFDRNAWRVLIVGNRSTSASMGNRHNIDDDVNVRPTEYSSIVYKFIMPHSKLGQKLIAYYFTPQG